MKARVLPLVMALSVTPFLTQCESPNQEALPEQGTPSESWSLEEHPEYISILGPAEVEWDLDHGEYLYCDLDGLERTQCAAALITQEDYFRAKETARQDISSVSPSCWGTNFKTEIVSANPEVEGSYKGWFWNRSHMIADSLGGEPIQENLITGTRTQNVGNRNNQGGMAYTENIARDYLNSPAAADCPLYYATEANYGAPTELVPRSVTVNIKSCNGTISEKVLVYNAARGYSIDYTTGEATPLDEGEGN